MSVAENIEAAKQYVATGAAPLACLEEEQRKWQARRVREGANRIKSSCIFLLACDSNQSPSKLSEQQQQQQQQRALIKKPVLSSSYCGIVRLGYGSFRTWIRLGYGPFRTWTILGLYLGTAWGAAVSVLGTVLGIWSQVWNTALWVHTWVSGLLVRSPILHNTS